MRHSCAPPRRRRAALAGLALLSALATSVTARAGPPFLTDDPEPTETGHWEIYGPIVEIDGRGKDFGGAAGVEVNLGAAPDIQLTLGVPAAFAHDEAGWRRGMGDLELSAKYRFYHDEDAGISIAAFPGMTLPTAGNGLGNGKVTALLPVWVQKDFGPWSAFGGGGYAINPGVGQRNYWTGGIAVTRQIGPRLLLGIEANRQGSASLDERASTSLGLGAIFRLPAPFRLLASGGPTFGDDGETGFHAFVALGIDF